MLLFDSPDASRLRNVIFTHSMTSRTKMSTYPKLHSVLPEIHIQTTQRESYWAGYYGYIVLCGIHSLPDNIEIIQKRCLKTIFPGYQYEHILQMVNLPTLHRRRDELCRVYFAKMKSSDHKQNALVPNDRSVPYALRLCNKLPIPRAKTNRYRNS